MTDFSRGPDEVLADNLAKGYVGLHIQQGVPILDRDLNLLQDLAAATVRAIVSRYLGSGVALRDGTSTTPKRSDAFLITAANADNDFVITAGSPRPGRCLINGIELTISDDLRYTQQRNPAALAPPTSGDRTDLVYLDAFLATEETGTVMDNPDIVVQTSVRLKPVWSVRVAPAATTAPAADPGHGHLPLAKLARRAGQPRITQDAITDLRPHCFALPDVRRLLLEPILFDPPTGRRPGDQITIPGRNFQFFKDDVVTVTFGAVGVDVQGAGLTTTSILVKIPTFPSTVTLPADMPLVVRTAYGSAQGGIRINPPL